VNRGCKALTESDSLRTESTHVGITRSIAFKAEDSYHSAHHIHEFKEEWKSIGESTSDHLKIIGYDIDQTDDHLFLTLYANTDQAMGMNMITIAAQAIGEWIVENVHGLELITIAGNVDSDKKPSMRVHEKGRGFIVTAQASIPSSVITSVLKTTPEKLLAVATAKLTHGSQIAGAVGSNLHVANVIAALYLATGQDAAHVVEGSLADTTVEAEGDGIHISVRLPAVLAGVRGGGTGLPAQSQALGILLKPKTGLHPRQQLAETIGAAVLAGELSLLAAQATHELAESHKKLAR
jgi:hydroxymethylglutaryl-CoA reductase (NADPH)